MFLRTKSLLFYLIAGIFLLTACGPTTNPQEQDDPGNGDGTVGVSWQETMYVNSETADCVGEAPQTCLLVKSNPDDEWEFFYDDIAGFEYESGYVYELLVQIANVENPPADGSSLSYLLVDVVEKVAVTTDAAPETAPEPTDEPETATEQMTMYVAAETADCVGVGPQTCLLVKFAPDDEWTFFYDSIAGFDYETGFEYELLVEKSDVENPPADASSIAYSLVSVVEKTAVETTTKPEDMGLDGTEWTLVAMGFNDRPEAVLAGTNITIAFAEDMVNGSAGCNSYFGNYSLTEAGFSVGVLGNTLMACEPDVMQQEDRFLQALAVVEKYSIENDTLIIEYDGGVMFFEKMAAEENMELEGTTWHLESFATKDAISSTLADTEVTATFAEGMVNGLASCNRYFGEATLVDGKATFGALGSTRMACVPEIMAQEVAFLTALQSATSYVIEGDVLTIDHADGSLIFRGVAEGDMGMDDVEPIPPVVAPITDTEMIRGEAFVDGFDINIMESFPVQVSLTVRGNLADGCTTLGDISGSVNADSKVIQINIGTVRPADLICTQALVPFEQVIPLDVAGLNAGIYTITVNGVSQEFTLEMDNVSE